MDIEKIKKDPGVILINKDLKNGELVGGALIDIDRGVKPKDYDVCLAAWKVDDLVKLGWQFLYETKTAYTLLKNDIYLQLLKTIKDDFDFKISQSCYSLQNNTLNYDKVSYNNKTLIPTTFDNPKVAKKCLFRIPHYQKKGYDIHPMTYLSLLNVALPKNNTIKSS